MERGQERVEIKSMIDMVLVKKDMLLCAECESRKRKWMRGGEWGKEA